MSAIKLWMFFWRKDFAKRLKETLCKEFFHIVTVKSRQYYVYRYEGNLNGMENASVLLTYPIDYFGKEKCLQAFICTDVSLSDEEILASYVHRWNIKVFFHSIKQKLAFEKYQLRSAIAIQRLWTLSLLAYFLTCSASESFNFLKGFSILAQKVHNEQFSFLYDTAVNSKDKSALLALVAWTDLCILTNLMLKCSFIV